MQAQFKEMRNGQRLNYRYKLFFETLARSDFGVKKTSLENRAYILERI